MQTDRRTHTQKFFFFIFILIGIHHAPIRRLVFKITLFYTEVYISIYKYILKEDLTDFFMKIEGTLSIKRVSLSLSLLTPFKTKENKDCYCVL